MNTTTERPAPAKHDYDRIPYLVAYQNNSAVRDVYGGIAELVVLESYLLKPRHRASDTVLVFMHPIGGGAYLPMINALARAGHHVIYCNSRFRGTDSALLMEKVVEDLGECIRDAKERLGYTKVVLAGWSGGGSLSAFYQQQAQRPTVTASPSGDGPDLTQLGLIPADGIMLLAAHISRHGTMTEWLDASILDETDPTRRDPELDLYDPANPNQPPYTAEFLERYRSAQIARNRRIDALRRQKRPEPEDLPWGPEAEPHQEDRLGLQQETKHLGEALASLPAKQRDLIEKAYFGDLTHTEIAEATGLPLGTIKSRIRLALQRLRHAMDRK